MTTSTEETGAYGPLKPDRIAAIEKLGAVITWGYEYVGQVNVDRHRVERDLTHPDPEIDCVYLPFTPAQWWEMTTRDGSQYIGPCCGNTGYVQDIFAGVYRDGGFIGASEFLNAAHMIAEHEGFETWGPVDDATFNDYIKSWEAATKDPEVVLDLWAIVGVILNAVEPGLKIGGLNHVTPERPIDMDPWRGNIRTLAATMREMEYVDLFADAAPIRDGYSSDEAYDKARRDWAMKDQQHAGERVLNLAKIAPLIRDLVDRIAEEQPTFNGYAIVDPHTDKVLTNGYGLCLFRDRVHAQRVLELWERGHLEDYRRAREQGREPGPVAEAEIVPCTADTVHGLTLWRGARRSSARR